MGDEARTLRSGFLRSVERHGDRPALSVAGELFTYRQLFERAASVAATLRRHDASTDDPALTAVLGHRHVTCFASILGALLRGHGYVPLNPIFPPDRSRTMLDRSGVRTLVIDGASGAVAEQVLEGFERPLLLVFPDAPSSEAEALRARYPRHRVLVSSDLVPASEWEPTPVDDDGIAYLLFTSGSTGVPKGVMVAHRNVVAFLDAMMERYRPTPEDRFSHTFDLTFDLSVFDLFLAWESGACVFCPTQQEKAFPGKYVKSADLTVWFSVPSTAVLMNKLRMLKPDSYPGLRFALFCGEALPVEVTQAFAAACPNAIVENLYGPTELTIACTLYRWDRETSPAECELGVVPIGEPYPNMEVLVTDEALHEVPVGETGELLMTGPQLTLGYYRDEERTAKAFVVPPGKDRIFYRTGDRVRRMPPGKPLVYLGRVDNQIKIQGYRAELGEIEAVLRDVSGADVAIAVGWPVTPSGADGVVAFVATVDGGDAEAIRLRANERLPSYMQPRAVRFVDEFPLNANGKVDRKALLEILRTEAS
jgi:amino acid adenylation domain-containing protein